MKRRLFERIEQYKKELCEMSDFIFDHPEYEGNEILAAEKITAFLEQHGFTVERGLAGFETAFRAVYQNGEGGPSIGMLCEYDALKGLGHGCGHQMQGPGCLGAAAAICDTVTDIPYKLVVYGTPAEETVGAKCPMLEAGCFQDIDVALMMHGGPNTCTDNKSMAMKAYQVVFHGTGSHAALAPEKGRSALDALLVAFNGIEFLREHVSDDARMHYSISELPGPSNVVPKRAVGEFRMRSYSKKNLDLITERFMDIIKGAALIAGVTYEVIPGKNLFNKIPVYTLNDLLIENAKMAEAPRIAPPREKTGSTDFGNVMYYVPGSCIRVAFVPEGTPSHTQDFVDAGKSEDAHACVIYGAKIMAGAAYDMITDDGIMTRIKTEFIENQEMFA